MIPRDLKKQLVLLAKKMPAIALTGPRQSGKTTLLKAAFPGYDYVNLEHPPTRTLAINDPEQFLSQYKKGLIIDEVQRVPELFSYLQVAMDKQKKHGRYILSGSQNFLLLENISQSLAGRVVLLNLLPFSYQEMKQGGIAVKSIEQLIFKGAYPAIYDRKVAPAVYYSSYLNTYVERDVRSLVNVHDLSLFETFIKLLAGRVGQLLNLTDIGNTLGIDHKTVKKWLSVLETSFIIYFLQPYHTNFNKRLVKTPKLYFYDTGLACNLLGIDAPTQLTSHWAKGGLFENFVINELIKERMNKGLKPQLYFWRDNTGNEVDLLIQEKGKIKAVEIKSSKTYNPQFFKGLGYYAKLSGIKKANCFLVYSGENELKTSNGQLLNWTNTCNI
ncbi:MAG: ATP-binding protein [Bacteroidetes bacterium]|nr:ATP-binding protein [Bacteroidota bacterium]